MKHIVLVLGVLLICISSVQTAYADSLNDNEIIIIEEAKKTYEYNGILYQVDPIYLEVLTDYLSRNDVDITAEDKDLVLKTAYDSIEIGVLEGYLIPVEEQEMQEENISVDSLSENVSIENSCNISTGTGGLCVEVGDYCSASETEEIMQDMKDNEDNKDNEDVNNSEDIKDNEDNNNNNEDIKDNEDVNNSESMKDREVSKESDKVIDIEVKDKLSVNHYDGVDQTVEVILQELKGQSNNRFSRIDNLQQSITHEDSELDITDINLSQTIIILTGLGILMVIGMIVTIRLKFFAQIDE